MVRRILSSTAGLAAVIFVVMAVSAAGYWYRQKLLETYSAMEQSALTALSLGLAAVAVWIVAFTAIAFAPVTPLRRTVLWASSVSMLAGVLGLLSFYDVYFGSLSWLTLGGEVSLGGKVGETIAGPPGAIAVARVAALFLIAAAAAMPSVTKVVGNGFGRFAVVSYVAIAFAFGKLADAVIMRVGEVFLSFPDILLVLLIAATVKPRVTEWVFAFEDATGIEGIVGLGIVDYVVIFGAMSAFSWVGMARLVRGQVLYIKESQYVEAAQATGASTFRVLATHVLPNVLGPVLVIATLSLAIAILTEATLSFLGVGIPVTNPSLGTLIRIGQQYLFSGERWMTIYPSLALVVLVLAVNLLGDWLRDALNPKLR